MTKSLRKRHLQIWTILLVLLPFGIISAKLVVPQQPADALLQPSGKAPLPFIVRSAEKENFAVYIRKSNDSTFQLHWINKNTLTYPTATIYLAPGDVHDIARSLLVGRIEARGTYFFSIKTNAANEHIIVYDFIHQQIIDTINFKQ